LRLGSDSAVDRLGEPPRQIPLQVLAVGALLTAAGVLTMFGAFAAFIWAAVDYGLGKKSAPSDFHALWFVPLGTLFASFACAAVAFWLRRSALSAGLAVFSLGVGAFILAISPYY
jgi:hypothetical protein